MNAYGDLATYDGDIDILYELTSTIIKTPAPLLY